MVRLRGSDVGKDVWENGVLPVEKLSRSHATILEQELIT